MIAAKAIEVGKPKIAIQLLKLEPNIAKRVPALLKMGSL